VDNGIEWAYSRPAVILGLVKDNYLVSGLHRIVFVWFIFIFEKIYVNTLVTVLIEPDGPPSPLRRDHEVHG
jgi:hypothetical protein